MFCGSGKKEQIFLITYLIFKLLNSMFCTVHYLSCHGIVYICAQQQLTRKNIFSQGKYNYTIVTMKPETIKAHIQGLPWELQLLTVKCLILVPEHWGALMIYTGKNGRISDVGLGAVIMRVMGPHCLWRDWSIWQTWWWWGFHNWSC